MSDYYHCNIIIEGEDDMGHYINDLDSETLFTNILIPFSQGNQFIFDGYMILPSKIKRLKIVKTSAPSKDYIDRHYASMSNSGITDLATIPSSIPISEGVDVTNEVLEEAKSKISQPTAKTKKRKNKSEEIMRNMFVVHGHDMASLHELCRVLKDDFKIEPIVLSEQPNVGLDTIISKFERLADTCTAVAVLLTPDDEVKETEKMRARQNVIFELGYFLGKLRSPEERKVMVFHKKDVDVPSDISGVVYYHYDKSITEAYYLMKKQLEIWGY